MSEPTRPCVVHLVREANGIEPFRGFLDALRRNPPGMDLELVLAMKGFRDRDDAQPYLDLAPELDPGALFFSDEGLDIGVYFRAAASLERQRYCFLNSYSEPLVAGWLAKLDAALGQPGTGLAGASGSWASARSRTLHMLGLPSAYRGVLPPRAAARAQFRALEADSANGTAGASAAAGASGAAAASGTAGASGALAGSFGAKLKVLRELPEQLLCYEGFPAQHVRTNGFMVAHDVLARLREPAIESKRDAYRFEHSRRSLTRQVQRLGLRTVIVDRDGNPYEPERWHLSRAFWQGAQEGLLIADNQTRRYERGDAERRRLLAGYAWGREAAPGEGTRQAHVGALA